MASLNFDTSDFNRKSKKFKTAGLAAGLTGLIKIAGEILRLGEREVPHDKGMLQTSGSFDPQGDLVVVGYNKEYAARLHEHPEYRFQKGRKGKFRIAAPTGRDHRAFGPVGDQGHAPRIHAVLR